VYLTSVCGDGRKQGALEQAAAYIVLRVFHRFFNRT